MNPISTRIKKFADEKKISIRQIEQSIGASNGLLSKSISKKTDILSVWVSKIIETYPDINPTWLLTGKGQMEKSLSDGNAKNTTENDSMNIQLKHCKDMIKSKEKIIKLLEDTIKLKDEKLTELALENENLKILLDEALREKSDYVPSQE